MKRLIACGLCCASAFAAGYLVREWRGPSVVVAPPQRAAEVPVGRWPNWGELSIDADLAAKIAEKAGTTPAMAVDEALAKNAPSEECGELTAKGEPCRNKVKGGGLCWRHR